MKIFVKKSTGEKTNDRRLAFFHDYDFNWLDRIINWCIGYVKK